MTSNSTKDTNPGMSNKATKTQKTLKAPDENDEATKKISTKEMIREALTESKSRKGISLYAIKKYMQEKFMTDTKKIDHIIKKLLKNGVENGDIVQTKGIGASGSFKLSSDNKTKSKKIKKPKTEKQIKNNKDPEKSKTNDAVTKDKKVPSKNTAVQKSKTIDKEKKKTKISRVKLLQSKADTIQKTPSKKRANLMKRKSIGSIIKPPKMKPKAVPR